MVVRLGLKSFQQVRHGQELVLELRPRGCFFFGVEKLDAMDKVCEIGIQGFLETVVVMPDHRIQKARKCLGGRHGHKEMEKGAEKGLRTRLDGVDGGDGDPEPCNLRRSISPMASSTFLNGGSSNGLRPFSDSNEVCDVVR
ncbi:hypothetical protein CH35J_003346 [Colletotrichum higginsianum]|uniref:Uncharacterized protein n=1 Tax=Colletotrichum higginsianum TaxID=80884 RepID=A0A4V4NCT9_9PEZI|nr:hypothetical protein CH35J_003346 [Colletotrichum higginsianum]